MEPLSDVWRTEDRLRTDDETLGRLYDLARSDPAIRDLIDDLQPPQAGNGSAWMSCITHHDRTPAVLKLGARETERAWMVAVDAATTDVVPRVFGAGDLRGVGWLVLERCEFTLDRSSPSHVAAVVTSTARYQDATSTISAAVPEMSPEWLREHLQAAQDLDCPGDVAGALVDLQDSWAFVKAQCGLVPNHGDVHLANAVARHPDGPALLIDPMPIRTVWAWDAAYLEATLAPYRSPDDDGGLVRELARQWPASGRPATADQLYRVEQVVLGWAAALWWRIAPWRHDNDVWRDWVEQRIEQLQR